MLWNITICFFIFVKLHEAANILVVIPYAVTSHYKMQRPIGLELARRGHNVTVITPYLELDCPPTYHQVKVSEKKIWTVIDKRWEDLSNVVKVTSVDFHSNILWTGGLALTKTTLKNPDVQKFLTNNQTFDAVISEQFYQEATYIFAHKYKAPLILITTFGSSIKHNVATRNPLQLATLVNEFVEIKSPNFFKGRLWNLLFSSYEYIWWRFWFLKKQEELVEKYVPNLPQPSPSLYELQQNVSLYLMNTHFSFDPPAAYLPNFIEIGGIHLNEEVEKLPQDIQRILDEASNGVVYVNFGSNIKSSELPIEKKNALINVFKSLNQTVLWKWEDDNFGNQTANIKTRKWLPQNEILAHQNVRIFISHGGLMGTIEAIFHGVPIIGIPLFGDQYNNLLQVENAGSGIILEYHNLNENNMRSLINHVLSNEKYKNNARDLSIRFRDRPIKALDAAMYWIEYVIRHQGAHFMKNPALKLNWFAYNMFDVYLFILCVFIISVYVSYRCLKFLVYFRINTRFDRKLCGKVKFQ
ncbi:UDP-glucuronosyltransferase 2B19-like [Bombyx mandarina]|uniref:UDP-glucuronosyltransferase 2B19-like n=1 Tax=Bombyx mandarina TaxID=7092 RepID=A0A6J2KPW8_BOMMA|nr:UDP-glucuronosyltransferase 2B19-like [Bombyx mandarina]